MRKTIWLYLSLLLVGMTMSTTTWSDRHSRGHSHSSSSNYRHSNNFTRHSHGGRSYGYRGHNTHRRYSGRSNLSLGVGVASSFGSYGHLGYSGRNIGVYGSFGYGRGYYPRYRHSYYRPYYRPYNYYLDSYYWSPYPSVVYPPVVVVPSEPSVYIQQQPAPQTSPALSTSATINYWYYCENPAGYYPEVERCSSEWIKVPPTPPQ